LAGGAHLSFDPLHSAIAEADELRNAVDTEAIAQRQSRFVNRAGAIQRSPKLSAVGYRAPQPCN